VNDSAGGCIEIGQWRGVSIAVAAHDAVSVDVDLSIAAMFAHEIDATRPMGGLLHLDEALGGALLRLRADGIFSAAAGELPSLSSPLPPVRAATVLTVGLGDIQSWSPPAMRIALAVAAARPCCRSCRQCPPAYRP
jgi:hypothetical protein